MKMKITLLTFLSILIGISSYAQPTIGTTTFGNQNTFGILATGSPIVSANAAGWTCTLVGQVISGSLSGTISMSIINSADTMFNISTPNGHNYQYISMKSSNTPTSKFKLNSFRFGAVSQANSYTINGYKDGNFVTGATTTVALAALSTQTTATYNLITVSNIAAFGNIDEFRIFPVGTVAGAVVHRLDDIDISTAVAPNSSPSFNNGATQNTLSCGSSLSLNTLLAVTDADNNQTLTWSVTGPPANGTLSGFSTTGTSNTSSVTPAAALAYTPNSSFEGTDNFTIQVSDGAATATTTITVLVNTATWNGNTSNNALNTTNWTGCAPAAGIKVIVPAGTTNAPSILLTSDVLTVGDLEIASGATFTNTGTLNITGTLTNNGGSLTSNSGVNGTVGFTGTTAQTIPANAFNNNTVRNLIINNAAGVTLAGPLNLMGTLTPTAGTLTTGGFLTLKYTSGSATLGGGHARIAAGASAGGYISGTVNVERFIQRSYRRYRFMGHPFTSLPLTEWTDDFDITGTITGSNANNFTTTQTNNPSAFSYNEAIGNAGVNPDPGWTAITSGNTVTTLGSGDAIRVMIRGTKGQTGSLTGGTYIPDSVLVDMSGQLFQGSLTVSTTFSGPAVNNNQKGFTLIGNPYASSWDYSTAVRTNVDNACYQYRPSINAYCAWINGTNINGGSQYIEMGAAFMVHANAVGGSITLNEAGKVSNVAPLTKLRTAKAIHNRVSLTLVQEATAMADEVAVRFGDDPATDKFDSEFDAYNLASDLDFYIAGADDVRYAIFHGSELKTPDVENRSLALGFKVLTPGTYSINAKILNAFIGGHTIYLKDAVLNTLTPITENTTYRFEATAGDTKDRFSLVFKPAKKIAETIKAALTTYPNPAKDVLNVTYAGLDAKGAASIRLINTAGKTVKTISLATGTEGRQSISLKGLAKGLYTVQLIQNGTTQTQNVVVD